MKSNIALIDIGSHSIKTFIVSQSENKHQIIGVGKSITSGFDGLNISNLDDFFKSIQKSFIQAARQSSVNTSDAIVLLPSNKNINTIIKETIVLNGIQVENNHIRKLQNAITTKVNSQHLHCFQSHFTLDGKIITDNPIGISCGRLSLDAIATLSVSQNLILFKNVLDKLNISIHNFYDSSIINFLFLKSLTLHKKNVVFIDFGFNSIKILIIKNEKIRLLKTILVGSNYITNDLVKILNVSNDFAEKIKITNIDLISSEKKIIEIPVWEELGNNLKRKIDHDYLKSIVSSRVDEIFNIILQSIPNSKFFYSYLITGGGSMQQNLCPYIKKKFGINIELIEPNQKPGIPNVLNNSALMPLFALNEVFLNNDLENVNLLKKSDSFSKKMWYKRFVDLL